MRRCYGAISSRCGGWHGLYEHEPAARDDLFQEIATALWTALPRFRGDSSERTWVYRVAHNTAISFATHGRRRREREQPGEVPIEPAVGAPQEADAIDRQQRDRLWAAVQELPVVDRAITVLYLDGLSATEIEGVTGLSAGAIATRLTACVRSSPRDSVPRSPHTRRSDVSDEELMRLWQGTNTSPAESDRLAREILTRVWRFDRMIFRRNTRDYVAGGGLFVFFVGMWLIGRDRAGALIGLLSVSFVMLHLWWEHRHLQPLDPAADVAQYKAALLARIDTQIRLLRGVPVPVSAPAGHLARMGVRSRLEPEPVGRGRDDPFGAIRQLRHRVAECRLGRATPAEPAGERGIDVSSGVTRCER